MVLPYTEIEYEIVKKLIDRIGEDRFDLWFEAENALSFDGRQITIYSAERFAQDRIRQFFFADLQEIVGEVVGRQVNVCFELRVKPENMANLHKQETGKRSDHSQEGNHAQEHSRQLRRPTQKHDILPFENGADHQSSQLNGSTTRQTIDQAFSLQKFEFDSGNSVLKAAIKETINHRGQWSPLYLYGPVGCGKTHLLRGIISTFRERKLSRSIYMTAEQFTSNFIEAIDGRGVSDFRRKCRGLDVLAIDDVQFFGGKRATLIEFQNTVEALVREGKQIILSADCSLPELNCFDPELINRIAGGLPCAVSYADNSSRAKIIRRQAKARGIEIEAAVVKYLAENLAKDIRHLSGALNRIHAAQLSNGLPASVDMVHELITDLIQTSRKSVTIREIEAAVGTFCGVEPRQMRSTARNQHVSTARMLAMFLSRRLTGTAYSEIGNHFGGRSHSTVISADKKIKKWIDQDHVLSINHTKCHIGDAVKNIKSKLKLA